MTSSSTKFSPTMRPTPPFSPPQAVSPALPPIRGLFKNVMDTVTSELTLHSLVTESSGDLAYDSGSYSETLVPVKGGPNQQFQGDYLTVFRRQKGGKWLIIQQVWTFAGNDVIPRKVKPYGRVLNSGGAPVLTRLTLPNRPPTRKMRLSHPNFP